MIELNEDIPFLWRLSSHDSEGFCMVSMVVPFMDGDESLEHTIETDVLSFASDICNYEEEELEWNEDDLNLFLKLLANRAKSLAPGAGEALRIDLADPETIEIVQIVAAAGFGLALPPEDILAQTERSYLRADFDLGSPVSIHTLEGFKRGVVVDIDDDDVVCVILDPVRVASPGQFEQIHPYDLLLLKTPDILHPDYTGDAPSGVLH